MIAARVVRLKELLDGLKAIPESSFTVERVRDYLLGAKPDPDDLKPYLYFRDGFYTRNLIFRNGLFQALTNCWNVGQAAPIHNHAGQYCWFLVVQGHLKVVNYRIAWKSETDPSRVRLAQTDVVPAAAAGSVVYVDRGRDIHEVVNDPEFGEPAVTLHIYSRPFDSCVVYDLKEETCREISLGFHTAYGRRVD